MGTIVGGFNHSDAICSTPFFALTVDIFPGETRGVCVQACVWQLEIVKDRTVWAQNTIDLSWTYCTSELYNPGAWMCVRAATADYFQCWFAVLMQCWCLAGIMFSMFIIKYLYQICNMFKSCRDISLRTTNFNSWSPLGTMNWNPSNNWWDVSVWTDWPIDIAIPRAAQLEWLKMLENREMQQILTFWKLEQTHLLAFFLDKWVKWLLN